MLIPLPSPFTLIPPPSPCTLVPPPQTVYISCLQAQGPPPQSTLATMAYADILLIILFPPPPPHHHPSPLHHILPSSPSPHPTLLPITTPLTVHTGMTSSGKIWKYLVAMLRGLSTINSRLVHVWTNLKRASNRIRASLSWPKLGIWVMNIVT